MLNGKHITVVIPAYNEALSIARVIADIPAECDQVIVVDNGSSDQTAAAAESAGAWVVVEQKKGYGAACMAGIHAAGTTDLIAFIDGDYSDYPEDLIVVIGPVASGRAGFSVGCRDSSGQGNSAQPWHQRFGNRLACSTIRFLYGYQCNDLGPMRCIERRVLMDLRMSDVDYGWTTEMQLKAFQAGFTAVQVPVRYRQRIGKSKISGTVKGTFLAGYKIFYWTLRLLFMGHKTGHSH